MYYLYVIYSCFIYRYRENRAVLREGMRELGFKELLDEKIAGYIISSYLYPKDPNFNFTEFYNRLNEKGTYLKS